MALTDTGLEIPTLEETREGIRAQLRSRISNTIDLHPSSPLGIIVDIFSREKRLALETVAAVYASMAPSGGSGVALANVSALTGTIRRPATASVAPVLLDLDAGTYPAGTLVANVTGRPGDTFSNAETLILAADNAALEAVFHASETGPIAAASGSLVISGPVAGWNGIASIVDAALGEDTERDAVLRPRRTQEVQAQGSTTVDAIRADISQNVEGIISVSVLENETATTDANGILPHSIEAIVYGPATPTAADDQAVADQIYASRPGATRTVGTTAVDVLTSQGRTVSVQFSRVETIPGLVDLTIEVDPLTYPGDEVARAEYARISEEGQTQGQDLDWSDAVEIIKGIPGVHRVTAVEIGVPGVGQTAFGSLEATVRQIIQVGFDDVVITSSEGVA